MSSCVCVCVLYEHLCIWMYMPMCGCRVQKRTSSILPYCVLGLQQAAPVFWYGYWDLKSCPTRTLLSHLSSPVFRPGLLLVFFLISPFLFSLFFHALNVHEAITLQMLTCKLLSSDQQCAYGINWYWFMELWCILFHCYMGFPYRHSTIYFLVNVDWDIFNILL